MNSRSFLRSPFAIPAMTTDPTTAQVKLAQFLSHADGQLLCNNLTGLEKESLRVLPDGSISTKPHPPILGSPLTHPYITTDFSEALLELITPPGNTDQSLGFLDELHRFIYPHLNEEYLWAASMPCILHGEENIPIAHYGSSARGLMKHIYRVGLGNRYGRVMQVIAGVHFNFSLHENAWKALHELSGKQASLQDFISESYMGLVRNLQRIGWLVPYLFGASPAVCESFFAGRHSILPRFDAHTLYEPYATSLRMGDMGYTNAKEGETGIKANYDSLIAYIESLECAIRTPCKLYSKLGVKANGEYRQLNDHILQIENEYYSTIRPKPIHGTDERPTRALRKGGIRYVELRSLDLNIFSPLGIDRIQAAFLEAMLLCCLFAESPPIGKEERQMIDINFSLVAHRGRQPGLMLRVDGGQHPLQEWGMEILEAIRPFCKLLDANSEKPLYCQALEEQSNKIQHPERTPSAKILDEMESNSEGFHDLSRRYALLHRDYFLARPLPDERENFFMEIARDSIRRQKEIEANEDGNIDAYLQKYFEDEAP